MTICTILQIYLAMQSAHLDTPANHIQIANGGKLLVELCEKQKKEDEKKKEKEPKKTSVGESKLH